MRCILSKFYIKPQRPPACVHPRAVVSYRNSTSNHNQLRTVVCGDGVVSYRNSTSNHNPDGDGITRVRVVSYRNSTSNHNFQPNTNGTSYGCILSKFYIKPQPILENLAIITVVSYRNSTSNHNLTAASRRSLVLYLIEILHQTTTFGCPRRPSNGCILSKFYIKPQHALAEFVDEKCCILSKFYIKPQQQTILRWTTKCCILSKFYIKPQLMDNKECRRNVVSYRNSTSNHNCPVRFPGGRPVVSYRNSTSNHNVGPHID